MPGLSKIEQVFTGKLLEDDVTPEQFTEAVQTLIDFTQVNPDEVSSLNDLARVTRDVGLAVRRIVLSCGVIQTTEIPYTDQQTMLEGAALIQAGDVDLGKIVQDSAPRNVTNKCLIIRTRKTDGSSTVTTASDFDTSLLDEYRLTQTIINSHNGADRIRTNYYAIVPVNVEIDRFNNYLFISAVDYRQQPVVVLYPLQKDASIEEIRGYVKVLVQLVKDLVDHLIKNRLISQP
jgi:hypothetical protein